MWACKTVGVKWKNGMLEMSKAQTAEPRSPILIGGKERVSRSVIKKELAWRSGTNWEPRDSVLTMARSFQSSHLLKPFKGI
jgi:hypothetical protein